MSSEAEEPREPKTAIRNAPDNSQALEPRVLCYLDRVTPAGYVEGWARDQNEHRACVLQILQHDNVIAETVADSYRQDLLQAGIGHGHYAFYARIHDALPGAYELAVFEKHLGSAIPIAGPATHLIAVPEISHPATVQDLLHRRRWTANDLAQHPGCLRLPENMRLMGPHRFVDVTYMFVLGRWMDDAGFRQVRQLESGELNPERFFRDLCLSNERAAKPGFLAGPYDGTFPYTLAG